MLYMVSENLNSIHHIFPFSEPHTWCYKDDYKAANVAREKAPDQKCEGNEISNLFGS